MIANLPIQVLRLLHPSGAYVDVCSEGASLLSAVMPDRNGQLGEVLLGYPSLSGWKQDNNFMGRTIGRFANRIAGASFTLNGVRYTLEQNDGSNCNHSGTTGIHHHIFAIHDHTEDSARFSTTSPAGEGGFPGSVEISVAYHLRHDLSLHISYHAVTDAPTPISLTNHAYFNLDGVGNVLSHELNIPSERMLETDASFIPTGRISDVRKSAFDFTVFKQIGKDIDYTDTQFLWNKGYNHCYLFDETGTIKKMAVLRSPLSGRVLTVSSTLPAMQVYSGGFLESTAIGRYGRYIQPSDGIALEAQFYPDAPNQPAFPCCILQPGEIYNHEIIYKFSTF